jgi:hypothetical protein
LLTLDRVDRPALSHELLVRRDLERVFDYREAQVERILATT